MLGHASGGSDPGESGWGAFKSRGVLETLEEAQGWARQTATRLYTNSGITNMDVDFENAYDGFSLFHVFWIEGFQFFGVKRRRVPGLLPQGDISINGPDPGLAQRREHRLRPDPVLELE